MHTIVPPWVDARELLPQWVMDRMGPSFLVLPTAFFVGHMIIHYMIKRLELSSRTADAIIWAGISIGSTLAWLYAFNDLVPVGVVQPELLAKLVAGRGTELMAISTTLFMFIFAVWPYYVLSALMSRVGFFSFLFIIRKTIPAAAILLTITSDTPMPSTVIRLTTWILRFLVVDAVIDIIAVRKASLTNSPPSAFQIAIKTFAIAVCVAFFQLDPVTPLSKLPTTFIVAAQVVMLSGRELNPFSYYREFHFFFFSW